MSALFPDVPFTLGVPPVLRDPVNNVDSIITELTGDVLSLGADTQQIWGVFDSNGALDSTFGTAGVANPDLSLAGRANALTSVAALALPWAHLPLR